MSEWSESFPATVAIGHRIVIDRNVRRHMNIKPGMLLAVIVRIVDDGTDPSKPPNGSKPPQPAPPEDVDQELADVQKTLKGLDQDPISWDFEVEAEPPRKGVTA